MSLFGQTTAWLRAVLRRNAAERDMQLEMAAHLEQAAARFVAGGMPERDAVHAARREFGAISVIQEQARDSRGGRIVNEITTDIRYALRYFARTPLTSLTIVFTLMLGIGVNAAAYSFAQGYLYNPPPGVTTNASLVLLQGTERESGRLQTRSFSYAELREYAAQPVFSAVAGWTSSRVVLDFGDGAESAVATSALYVTPNYFSALNLRLAAGAGFVQTKFDENSDAEMTTVINYAFALSQFGTVASAIGQKLHVNDAIVTVAGVAPPRFMGAEPNTGKRLLFMPISALGTVEHLGSSVFTSPDSALFRAVAQVKPGVRLRAVTPIVANVAARHVAAKQPDKALRTGTTTAPRLRGMNDVTTSTQQTIVVTALFGALDVVILLVCITTVSSLLIGAAVSRRHEIGVRLALGASRWRIVRQLITETAILAWLGAAGGLALCYALTRAAFATRLPIDVVPTWHAALFTATFAVAIALLCGLSPALHATRQGLSDVLKNSSLGATSRSRLQETFVIAQIAFAQPLLVILGMTVVSLYAQVRRPNDVNLADNLIVAQFDPRNSARNDGALDALARRLAAVSGISAVVSRPEMVSLYKARVIEPTGALSTEKPLAIRANYVSTGYMEQFGIKLLAGRTFISSDTWQSVRPLVVRTDRGGTSILPDAVQGVRPLIVRADFAKKAFGGGNPIGRRLCVFSCTQKSDTLEIVGVVAANWQGLKDRG
ncbi:MAG: ABC transporter permease, partial [Gemmatimonadaceae bacterium]